MDQAKVLFLRSEAQKLRHAAQSVVLPQTKTIMVNIADTYDRIADAEQRRDPDEAGK